MRVSDPFEQRLRSLSAGEFQPTSDFDLNAGEGMASSPLQPAAVLIAFQCLSDDWHVWLTLRSAHLRHHPGQIAFPGGKVDAGDPSLEGTALREAHEEMNLDPRAVDIYGAMTAHRSVTSFAINPVLGIVHGPFDPRPEAGEVDEVFAVPVAHVLDVRNFRVESRVSNGVRRHYYTAPFGPYYIWGATARILFSLATVWRHDET